jgi:hypothetical protein
MNLLGVSIIKVCFMADYPCNFVYNQITQTLSWDEVPDSEEYLITSSDYSSGIPNQIIYEDGTATSCSYIKSQGIYYVKGKRKPKTGDWGVWGQLEPVVVA